MARINDVLSAQIGEYKWGERDCLKTASMIIQAQGYVPPDYSTWYQYTELQAIAQAKKTYGSMYEAHKELFQKAGLIFYECIPCFMVPGDIILLHGKLESNQLGITIDTKDITRLGFLSESYEVWSWFEMGLKPLSYFECRALIRCPLY